MAAAKRRQEGRKTAAASIPDPTLRRTLAELNLPHACREVVDKSADAVLDEIETSILLVAASVLRGEGFTYTLPNRAKGNQLYVPGALAGERTAYIDRQTGNIRITGCHLVCCATSPAGMTPVGPAGGSPASCSICTRHSRALFAAQSWTASC